jgi:hypothetical protein
MTRAFAVRLLVSTALTLAAAAMVLGDDNQSYVGQNGSENTLSVTQSAGSRNQAGYALPTAVETYVRQGTADAAAYSNRLTIVQSGDDNRAGAISGGNGILQTGNANSLTLTQSSDRNAVNRVTQSGSSTASITQQGGSDNVLTHLALDRPGSSATIVQNGDGNWIGPLADRSGAAPGLAFASQNGVLSVTQNGSYNRIDRISVISNGSVDNDVSVTLTGDHNQLRAIEQADLAGTVGGANQVLLDITGSRNNAGANNAGGDAASGLYRAYGSFASASWAAGLATGTSGTASDAPTGVEHGTVLQRGTSNIVAFGLAGDDNQFGISQWGAGNAVNAAALAGNLNDIGILQSGTDNVLDLLLLGDGNDLGITQSGGNAARLDVMGGQNSVGIVQTGSSTATTRVTGDGNRLVIDQQGSNAAGIEIFGTANNVGSFAGFFAAALAGSDLAPGSVTQQGTGNGVTLTLGSGLGDASANIFAVLQVGSDNTITGTIQGDGNQALLIQVGSAHSATFTQFGGSNYLSATQ